MTCEPTTKFRIICLNIHGINRRITSLTLRLKKQDLDQKTRDIYAKKLINLHRTLGQLQRVLDRCCKEV